MPTQAYNAITHSYRWLSPFHQPDLLRPTLEKLRLQSLRRQNPERRTWEFNLFAYEKREKNEWLFLPLPDMNSNLMSLSSFLRFLSLRTRLMGILALAVAESCKGTTGKKVTMQHLWPECSKEREVGWSTISIHWSSQLFTPVGCFRQKWPLLTHLHCVSFQWRNPCWRVSTLLPQVSRSIKTSQCSAHLGQCHWLAMETHRLPFYVKAKAWEKVGN